MNKQSNIARLSIHRTSTTNLCAKHLELVLYLMPQLGRAKQGARKRCIIFFSYLLSSFDNEVATRIKRALTQENSGETIRPTSKLTKQYRLTNKLLYDEKYRLTEFCQFSFIRSMQNTFITSKHNGHVANENVFLSSK